MSMFTTLIKTSELAARIGDPSVVIVDMRHDLTQPDHWGISQFRLGHIPGALLLPLEGALTWPDSYEKTVSTLIAAKKPVVTYCA